MSFFAKGASSFNNGLIKFGKKTGINKRGRNFSKKYSDIGQRGYANIQDGNVIGIAGNVLETMNEGKSDFDNYYDLSQGKLQNYQDMANIGYQTGILSDETYETIAGNITDYKRESALAKQRADKGYNKAKRGHGRIYDKLELYDNIRDGELQGNAGQYMEKRRNRKGKNNYSDIPPGFKLPGGFSVNPIQQQQRQTQVLPPNNLIVPQQIPYAVEVPVPSNEQYISPVSRNVPTPGDTSRRFRR